MATLGGAPPAGWPSDKLVGEIYWVRAMRGEPVALYRATRIGVVVTKLPAHIVESIEPLEEHRRLRLAQALPAIAGQPTRMWPRPEHDLEAKKRSLAEACAHALAPHTKHPAIGSCRTDHQLEAALDYARRQARLRTDAGEGEIWIERIDDEERLCAGALYANEQARRWESARTQGADRLGPRSVLVHTCWAVETEWDLETGAAAQGESRAARERVGAWMHEAGAGTGNGQRREWAQARRATERHPRDPPHGRLDERTGSENRGVRRHGLAAGPWTRHGAEIGIPAGCFGAAAAYLAVIAICGAIEKARKKRSRTEG